MRSSWRNAVTPDNPMARLRRTGWLVLRPMAGALGFGAQSLGIFFLQIPWGNWPKAKGAKPPLFLARIVVVTNILQPRHRSPCCAGDFHDGLRLAVCSGYYLGLSDLRIRDMSALDTIDPERKRTGRAANVFQTESTYWKRKRRSGPRLCSNNIFLQAISSACRSRRGY